MTDIDQHPHPLEGKLEPECRDVRSPMECAALSIAISLKRIADAIEGTSERHALADSIYFAISNALLEDMQRRS